ncbi:MAG: NF038122 family metalloprotease [Phenylobacterium sp.]
MTLPTEAVTLAGSGLVFINDYSANVSDAYRSAIISAENFLQSHFTNQLTVSVDFDFAPLGAGSSASNNFSEVNVSYSTFVAALRAHATTADDMASISGLPTTDPSGGAGFAIPTAEAVMLGLAKQSNNIGDSVTLNSNLAFTFGQDAIGAVEHELTEGVFGRIGSLGFDGSQWNPMDLFRFTASGQRDFTGGTDGVQTFFGIDSSQVSSLAFHNSISASGQNDGQDLADWAHTVGDAFGPGGPNSPGAISATDLQVLDVLGWNPTSASGPFTPAPDDFASSLSDLTHPFGALAVGGTASGVLQQAGDRDWFAVQLQAGNTYSVTETGATGRGGTLADPFLRLHDSSGATIASDDDIVDGTNPDSRLSFTPTTTGTYYVEAGAFVDGYAGSYTVGVTQTGTGTVASGPGQVITGAAGGDTIQAPETNDTITAGAGGANYLRGNGGDDSIQGGAAFDDINGNKGNDTIDGGSGGSDWLVGGQGNDSITAHHGSNLILGNLGNDTLQAGDGQDVLRGGQGDDVIVGGAGHDYISGDLGNDTETGGAGPTLFHGSQNIGADEITNFSYAKGDRVELDPGTTFSVSQVGANTVIDMGGGNHMTLDNVQVSTLPSDWLFQGTLSHL